MGYYKEGGVGRGLGSGGSVGGQVLDPSRSLAMTGGVGASGLWGPHDHKELIERCGLGEVDLESWHAGYCW